MKSHRHKPTLRALRLRLKASFDNSQATHYFVRPNPDDLVQIREDEWEVAIVRQLRKQGLRPYAWGEDNWGIYCYAEQIPTYHQQMAALRVTERTVAAVRN